MGANLKGLSPLQEIRIDELLAKDKVGIVRFRLKEVWSKTASPRTEMPYKAQPEDKQVLGSIGSYGSRGHNTSEVRLI